MNKQFIIHDLDSKQIEVVLSDLPQNITTFSAKPMVKHCIGCFGCWIKTPGVCIMKDRCRETPAMIAQCDEVIIISRNLYGGFSPEIKAVLDRSIGYMMPYFRIIHDEMHHTMRYNTPIKLRVLFYGSNIEDVEKDIAKELIAANALNYGAASHHVSFYESLNEVKEALK